MSEKASLPTAYRQRGLAPVPEHDAVRDGKYVVFPLRDAELPDRCIFCNQPAHGYRKGLYWAKSRFSPRYFVELPLCEGHRDREASGRLMFRLGIAVAILGFAAMAVSPWLCGAFLLVSLVVMIAGIYRASLLRVQRCKHGMLWIKTGRRFLSSIPEKTVANQ